MKIERTSAESGGEDFNLVWEAAVHLHELEGYKAVEPGIGHFLHDLFVAFVFDLFYKLRALVFDF